MSSWYFSALNALTTLIPVKFSLVTLFTLSIKVWTFWKFGYTSFNNTNIVKTNISTAPPVSALQVKFLSNIFITAQTAVIGDFIINCNPIAINISTWVTSFVVLVIKLLTENLFISSILKSSILVNKSSLVFLENDAAINDEKYPTIQAKIKLPPAHSSIYPPCSNISFVLLPSVCTSFVISDI